MAKMTLKELEPQMERVLKLANAAYKTWLQEFPEASDLSFACALGEFLARAWSTSSDGAFEEFIAVMRARRADYRNGRA